MLGIKINCTGDSQRGAAMLEFTIVFPVFLVLLFAVIDFSQVVAQKIAVSDALGRAGRFASLQTATIAVDAAKDRFQIERNNHPVKSRFKSENWDNSNTGDTQISGAIQYRYQDEALGVGTVCGITAVQTTSIACDFFCPLLTKLFGAPSASPREIRFTSSIFYPLEEDFDCP